MDKRRIEEDCQGSHSHTSVGLSFRLASDFTQKSEKNEAAKLVKNCVPKHLRHKNNH